MAVAAGRLSFWWFVVFVLAILSCCSARHTVSFSGNDDMVMHGRSLMAVTDDYNEPSANRGHDPRNRGGIGGRKNP